MRGNPHMWGGPGPFFGFFAFLVTLAILGAIAYLVYRKLQKRNPGGTTTTLFERPPAPRPDPISVLDDRLARGEIEVDDYRQRRAALLDAGAPPFATTHPEPPAASSDDSAGL